MLRVLVTDDEPIFLGRLNDILARDNAPLEICQALSGKKALELLAENKFDAMALDIDMPIMSGIKVLEKVKGLYPKLPVLMFSFLPEEDERVLQALKLGADGYLMKWNAPSFFQIAIERITSGGKYFSKKILGQPICASNDNTKIAPHKRLSKSEYSVFLMLADGKSVKEIAMHLNVHPNTISTYKQRILEKTGLANIAEIVRYAIRMKLA